MGKRNRGRQKSLERDWDNIGDLVCLREHFHHLICIQPSAGGTVFKKVEFTESANRGDRAACADDGDGGFVVHGIYPFQSLSLGFLLG